MKYKIKKVMSICTVLIKKKSAQVWYQYLTHFYIYSYYVQEAYYHLCVYLKKNLHKKDTSLFNLELLQGAFKRFLITQKGQHTKIWK